MKTNNITGTCFIVLLFSDKLRIERWKVQSTNPDTSFKDVIFKEKSHISTWIMPVCTWANLFEFDATFGRKKKPKSQCTEKTLKVERPDNCVWLPFSRCARARARLEITPRNSDGTLNSRQTCSRAKQWETIEIVCDTHVDRPGIYDTVGAFHGLCSNTTKTLHCTAGRYCSTTGALDNFRC